MTTYAHQMSALFVFVRDAQNIGIKITDSAVLSVSYTENGNHL